jgi:formylmethanofuran dehydrogenase subunit E
VSSKPRERKVSKSVALAVIQKLKAGKATVHGEARRLGVYHATLRKELRAAIGSKQYDKLFSRERKAPTKKEPPKRKARPPRSDTPERVHRRELYRSKPYRKTVPTFSQVAGEFRCGRCGSDHLKAGTNGNGGGTLWCSCGWTRAIPRVRATAAAVA